MVRITDWHEFRRSLVLLGQDAIPWRPTIDDLNDFERRTGRRLPKSYRDFILEFGPGWLAQRELEVAAPGFSSTLPYQRFNLEYVTRQNRNGHEAYPDSLRPRLEQLGYFGIVHEKFSVAWDHAVVTDPDAPEFAIVEVTFSGPEPRASSFREFVERICSQAFVYELDQDDRDEGVSFHTFQPAPPTRY